MKFVPGNYVTHEQRYGVSSIDLIHHTLWGLDPNYNTLVTCITHLMQNMTFDDLRANLLVHEQHIKHVKSRKSSSGSSPHVQSRGGHTNSITSTLNSSFRGPSGYSTPPNNGCWRITTIDPKDVVVVTEVLMVVDMLNNIIILLKICALHLVFLSIANLILPCLGLLMFCLIHVLMSC